jgi:hypothetical protein
LLALLARACLSRLLFYCIQAGTEFSGIPAYSPRRETSARQDQAHSLGWKDIKEFIASAGEGLRVDREGAMLCIAYETLARRGEFVALEVRDIDFHPSGTGQASIRRGKTDAKGQGRVAYLSRDGAMVEGVAGACTNNRRGGVSAVDRKESDWRCTKPRQHCGNLHTGGAVDRYAAALRGPGEWHSTRVGAAHHDDIGQRVIDLDAL